MTVAELAKRFEKACAREGEADTSDRGSVAGRVKELTRRLEKAVIDSGSASTASDPSPKKTIASKPTQLTQSPSRVKQTSENLAKRSSPPPESFTSPPWLAKKAPSEAVLPSPRPSPRNSHVQSNVHVSPSSSHGAHVSPPPFLPKANAKVSSTEQLSSASKITDPTKSTHSPQPPNPTQDSPPKQLTLSERLAIYKQLTSASQHVPTPNYTSTTLPPRASTASSSSSAASSQRQGPVDLIPDVSEGDLDDIEGMERVDDEHEASTNSNPSEDDNATFRRAKTVHTLPTTDSQSSHPVSEPGDPPSNPSTPSNAAENSSFSSAEFASAAEEFYADRPPPQTRAASSGVAPRRVSNLSTQPHTLAIPSRSASRRGSNLSVQPHTLAAPPRTAPRRESSLSVQSHTLHIAPGSFKNLPKAKVMIARRRGGQEDEKDDPGASNDSVNTRKLIREYQHPKELLKGSVSLVDLSEDNDDETVEFKDPEISPIKRATSLIEKKKNRVEAFRHRYDEFMDPHEIERANEMPVEERDRSGSKQRYQRRRLFRRGKVEKARQREERLARQREAVARRSTVISGAIDRVSLAADPWIDFITDTNTLPVTKAAGGGLRRGLKRLFGFGRGYGRQNAGLIKNGK